MGALKSAVIIAAVFFFIALVPFQMVKDHVPKLLESRAYQFAAQHNPMGSQSTLDQMRSFRETVMNPMKNKQFENNPEVAKLFERHQLKSVMRDERFVKAMEEGDYEQLQKIEHVEELMKDQELNQLLSELDRPAPRQKLIAKEKPTSGR